MKQIKFLHCNFNASFQFTQEILLGLAKSILSNLFALELLQYIHHKDLDKELWNSLVLTATNTRAFYKSDYLDQFCSWDAIVLNNYEAGIALPYKRKFGFKILHQPPFVQLCVWIGKELSQDQNSALIHLIASHFDDIRFNTNLHFPLGQEQKRLNLTLDLNRDFNSIASNFSKSLLRNLEKKKSQDLEISYDSTDFHNSIALYRAIYGSLNPQLTDKEFIKLIEILPRLKSQNRLEHVVVKQNNEVNAALFFYKDNNRLHYILGAPTQEGRKLNSLSFAIRSLIKKYSNTNMLLDFEGSSIKGVAQFYRSFGAEEEFFNEVSFTPNRLLRLVKRFVR